MKMAHPSSTAANANDEDRCNATPTICDWIAAQDIWVGGVAIMVMTVSSHAKSIPEVETFL